MDIREVINAIRYLLHHRCPWRSLPASFPNASTVRHYYDRWRRDGTWERVQALLPAPDDAGRQEVNWGTPETA
jgi:putative transposase